MITFKGVVRDRKGTGPYIDIFDVDMRRGTEAEKEMLRTKILSVSDGALDRNGNYLLPFEEK